MIWKLPPIGSMSFRMGKLSERCPEILILVAQAVRSYAISVPVIYGATETSGLLVLI